MLMTDFLKEADKSDAKAADELGYTPECVRLWRTGKRMPRPDAMARIERWSNGKITAADFYRAAAKAA